MPGYRSVVAHERTGRRTDSARLVKPRGVGDADDQPLGGEQPGDGLPPWLLAGVVDELEARVAKFGRRARDRRYIGHLELDRRLRHGHIFRPRGLPEARLRRLGERPDTEVPGAADLLAVEVVAGRARLERQPQRVDVETAARGRVGRNDGEASDELDVHGILRLWCPRDGSRMAVRIAGAFGITKHVPLPRAAARASCFVYVRRGKGVGGRSAPCA